MFYRKLDVGDGKGTRTFTGDTLAELNEKIEAALQAARPVIETGYQITLTERG